MTATFASALPRTGDVISVAPGAGPWKAAFRARVTEVVTRDSKWRPLATPIIGVIVINKDGSDRKAHAERAFDYRADLVTLVTPAQPTSMDLYRAYDRQAAMVRATADPESCVTAKERADNPTYGERDGFLYPPKGDAFQYATDPATLVGRVQVGTRIRYSSEVLRYTRSSARFTETFESKVYGVGRDGYGLYLETREEIPGDDEFCMTGQATTISHRIEIIDADGNVIPLDQVARVQLPAPVPPSVEASTGEAADRAARLAACPGYLTGRLYEGCSHCGQTVWAHPIRPGKDGRPIPAGKGSVQGVAVPVAPDRVEPAMIESPADVMAEARTLRAGDHVSGRTGDRKYFAGYLCADPSEGRDRHGNHAIVIMLASAPVDGKGAPWCITRAARFARLPIDQSVTAEGETMSAMYAMRRAGYTVTGARCDALTAHHAHIYRRPETPARTRFACRGLVLDSATEAATAPVAPPATTEPTDTHGCPVASVNAYGRYGHRVGCPDHAEPSDAPSIEPVPAPRTESEAPMPVPTTATEAAPVPAGHLVATIDRADLVEAFTYVIKFVPAKTALPAYAAVVLTATTADQVTMSCDAFDAAMTVRFPADVATTGTVMINARELSGLVKATPAPKGRNAAPTLVTIAHQGDRVTVTAGASASSAPVVTSAVQLAPVPVVPETPIMLADADAFAATVNRVTPAAGTDDTFPHLMCVQMTTTREGDRLRMLATNRERAAEAGLPVACGLDADTDAREHLTPGLVLAKPLALVATVAAKTAGTTVDVTAFAHRGDNWHGYRVGRYAFALRMIAGELPPIARMFDTPRASTVVTDAAAFGALVKRVSLAGQKSDPLRVTVAADQAGEVTGITVDLIAGSRVVATETMAATGHASDGYTVAFTHHYLSTALAGVTGDATMATDPGTRYPAVTVAGTGADGYRALIQSRRIDGPILPATTATTPAPAEAAPAPVQPTEAAPVVDPVDVHAADQVKAAGDALVTVHGVNGHRAPITLTGTVKHVNMCLTGRVAGLVRVQLDTGRTIYVPVTATTKEDAMTATSTTTRNIDAEKRAGAAFAHATDGNYADAYAAMTEAAAMVPTGYRFGNGEGQFTAEQITVMITAHEATGAFRGTPATQPTPAPAPATDAPAEASTEARAEAAPTGDQGDADMVAHVRDALSRVTWQGVKLDGRSADLMVLPRVSRAVYLAIKTVVEPLGGGYARKAGNRPGGFAFAPSTVIHGTGGFTLSGREKVAAWLAGDTPAEATEAAPVQSAEVTPAPVQLPTSAEVDTAYAAGYAAALAAMTSATPAPAPAPVPAPATEASTATFTLPDFGVSGEVYGVSVAAIAERLAGHKGVTVKRVARKGADRRKFTVTGPASAHAVAAAYITSLESRTVKA